MKMVLTLFFIMMTLISCGKNSVSMKGKPSSNQNGKQIDMNQLSVATTTKLEIINSNLNYFLLISKPYKINKVELIHEGVSILDSEITIYNSEIGITTTEKLENLISLMDLNDMTEDEKEKLRDGYFAHLNFLLLPSLRNSPNLFIRVEVTLNGAKSYIEEPIYY